MVNVDTERTIKAVQANASRTIMRVAFQCANELKIATPVDTGWARANWLVSIGAPTDAKTVNDGQKGQGNASTTAQQAGEAQLLVYNTNKGNIYLQNNVPYIQKLNEGSSPKAPAGFVEMAIDAAVRMITGGGAV